MNSIGDIVNLTAVPYGNADIDTRTKTVSCQHGADECSANIYEQCAMSLNADDQTAWFSFYVCMENAGESMIESAVLQACATSAGIDGDAIQACHDDPDQAWASQLAASEATDPAHEYTPWVVVGGTGPYYTDGTLLQYEELLTRTVCNAYTGTKPAGCPSADRYDYNGPLAKTA